MHGSLTTDGRREGRRNISPSFVKLLKLTLLLIVFVSSSSKPSSSPIIIIIIIAMVILLAIPSKLAQLFPSIPTLIPKRTQEWKNGLCSCSPGDSCVLSLFLPDLRMLDLSSTAPVQRWLMSI